MRRLMVVALAIGASFGVASAQRGDPPATNPGAEHSNAPAGTPAASRDRDTGTNRADDVGDGKKEGLKKNRTKTTGSDKNSAKPDTDDTSTTHRR